MDTLLCKPLVCQSPVRKVGAHPGGVPQVVAGIGPAAGHDNGLVVVCLISPFKYLNAVIAMIGNIRPAVVRTDRHRIGLHQFTGVEPRDSEFGD